MQPTNMRPVGSDFSAGLIPIFGQGHIGREKNSKWRRKVMSEFTYLFRGRKMSGSPEEMQQHFEKWAAWFKELAAKGHMRDPGHPLEATGKVVSGKQKIVNDGPYAEAKDVVGGYIVVEADDLAHAAELSKGCPILEAGGSVEIRPIQRLNM